MMEIVYKPQAFGSPERAHVLDQWLTEFYRIYDYDVDELRFRLRTNNNPNEFALHTLIEPLEIDETSHEGTLGNEIRIRTSSDRKWIICAGITVLAYLNPIRDIPTQDEEQFHKFVRVWDTEFPKWYPVKIARAKQVPDRYKTPLITLDTVTYVDGEPLEKPQNLDEARKFASNMSGKEVTVDTGWVVGLPLQSGRCLLLANSTRLTYSMKSLSVANINHYVETTSTVLTVPGAVDLSDEPSRGHFINTSLPITLRGYDCFGRTGELLLPGNDLYLSLFNPLFAGVPVHAIQALLPRLKDIYSNADRL